jgi:hypothetical protein
VKIFVEEYDETDMCFTCITGKGKQVFMDVLTNSEKYIFDDFDPHSILGQRFKLKNKSESYETVHGTYFYPKDSEWYPLRDKAPIVDCEKFFD